MRDKQLLHLFLFLNVALAACFAVYLFLSSNHSPAVTGAAFPSGSSRNPASPAGGSTSARTNPAAVAATNLAVATGTNAVTQPGAAAFEPIFSQRKFGPEQIESDERGKTNEYQGYLGSLRAVGCPEDKIRYIVLADINGLFARKRLNVAVTHDLQWWKSEPEITIAGVLQEKGRQLEDERRLLIEKYLGPEALESEKGESVFWSNVQLTGPVLGALSPELHNAVQEVCAKSIERHQAAFWARINDGKSLNAVDAARLREQTRSDLRRLLPPEAMEEFLLRYSHNAHELRSELRGFEPTPEEFRKILRATDVMDHQLQLEYGGVETLSPQQRERYVSQRDAAIREALGPKRFEAYLLVKDPLYRQAQAMALQHGASPKSVMSLYELTRLNEGRRQKILNDTTLSPQQKSEALNAVSQDQTRSVMQIISDARNR